MIAMYCDKEKAGQNNSIEAFSLPLNFELCTRFSSPSPVLTIAFIFKEEERGKKNNKNNSY
jgi:hypothetical protein